MTTLTQIIAGDAELAQMAAAGDYPGVAAALNEAPMVDNPEEQATVQKRVTMLEVFQTVATAAPADLAKAGEIPSWLIDRAEQMMAANDRLGMANYLATIGAAAELSDASKAALALLLAQTEPDPAWTSTVPGAPRWQSAGLAGPVDAAAVQGAVHANP